jgi:glycosyltransferase involved in cell wall biosynthesis
VIAGSHSLHDYAAARNGRVKLIPSSVPVERYRTPEPHDYHVQDRPFRLGWIGSPSTVKYLRLLREIVAPLRQRGHDLIFVVVGIGRDRGSLPDLGPMEVVDEYHAAELPGLVSGFDIGVMPLSDGPWERGKCAMKALVCMAGGKPVVCSHVGENAYVIEDGVNGYLAASPEQWIDRLDRLMRDEQLRIAMGQNGRCTVEKFYSTQVCFTRLQSEVLGQIVRPEPLSATTP